MNDSILVAYASKYGATKEIAEKICDVLRQAKINVDMSPSAYIRDLTPYRAVILGSSIYIGKWHKDAVTFLHANEKALANRPTWLFSSGPTGEGDPVELVEGQRLPAALQPLIDRIHPRDIAVFHGNINPNKINFIEKWAVTKFVKKPMGDFRDWKMIIAWTTKVADALKITKQSG